MQDTPKLEKATSFRPTTTIWKCPFEFGICDSNNSLNLPSWRDVQEGQLLSRCRQCISNMCEANSRAEKLLESFGKELNCNVCLYLMDHPRKLPCHHAFCRECIETALQHNGCCPVCKQVTKAGLDTVVKRVYPVGNHQAFSWSGPNDWTPYQQLPNFGPNCAWRGQRTLATAHTCTISHCA